MTVDAAVVLAGGGATRLGGVDKVLLEVGGRCLLRTVVSAARSAGAGEVVVVGPRRPGFDDVTWTWEQPAGGGPAAALAAGLTGLQGLVAVLAGDLPLLDAPTLVRLAAAAGDVGAVAVDADGREQWLLGVHRDLVVHGDVDGLAVRRVLDRPGLVRVPVLGPQGQDCDTPDDLARVRSLVRPLGSPRGRRVATVDG